ncbi:hypothetical protein [Acidovorax soli]|uniref:Uncharacterized protein n=1 Tax=Acidovorax soli TaxID=592050 RepID=A0A1H4BWS5_9BURK|nr:hypothetical protein [Acidovorax soli]SEA52588.1 hypothetical protein SAMN05421875_11629 [Acidovorax soli]
MKLAQAAAILALSAVALIAAAGEIKHYTQAEFDKLIGAALPAVALAYVGRGAMARCAERSCRPARLARRSWEAS